jgi:muconolactone delta-isomerase
MAQFIALLRRNTDQYPASAFTPELLEVEAERARELYTQGVYRMIWSRGDVPGAAILLEAESAEAAMAVLSTLPLYARGMLPLDALVPLVPYRGFAPRGG